MVEKGTTLGTEVQVTFVGGQAVPLGCLFIKSSQY